MKNLVISVIALVLFNYNAVAQELAPYIKIGESTESVEKLSQDIIKVLKDNAFMILGSYSPSNKDHLKVIAFTRNDVKNKVVQVINRGALAATFKVGLVKKDGIVTISYTNPDYLLRAYLMTNYNSFKSTFVKFSEDLKTTFAPIGSEFLPFGGGIEAEKLKKYHYKIMMPYFTDPVELAEFSTFEEGLKVIENNLNLNKGNTKLVYKLEYTQNEVAVFGVGLLNGEEGEPHFLPIIGEEHAAALPYEIILQGTQATMLHGKYRIALHWPDLTMGTFMKIMSTPGDIKDVLKEVCQ